ncbi:MAG: VWA domain-containing protein [Spirochaetes bacterium]|nr:VWA domain-containing protein [Spirochaetota bacterium]
MIITQTLGLWLLALVPIIVLAHLLFQRRRVQPVSSIMIWKRLGTSKRRRLWIKRVLNRHLLLQVLAVILAALALSQPTLRSSLPTAADHRVLLLDTSASMAARDSSGARIAAARRTAVEIVRDSSRATEFTLIEMRASPHLVGTFDRGDPRLLDAIETVSATDEPTDIVEALDFVQTISGEDRNVAVEIITDAAFAPQPLAFDPDRYTLHAVGAPADNAAITAFEIRRTPDDSAYQLFARIANNGSERLDATLRLLENGNLVTSRSVSAEGGGTTTVTADLVGTAGGRMLLSLEVDDALAADNRAFAALSGTRRIDVALITEGNRFLASALAVHPNVRLRQYSRYGPEIDADVIVLDRFEGVPIVEGRVLAINSTVAGIQVRPAGFIENVGDVAWSDTHPVTAGIDMSGTFLRIARPYILGAGARAILNRGPHVLGYVADTPSVRVVGFGFDLQRSNVPLHPGFPMLMRRAIEWLYPQGGEAESWQVSAGEIVQLETLPGTPVRVTHPNGEVSTYTGDELSVPFADTSRVGLYEISRGDTRSALAVNLLSAAESDLTPRFAPPQEVTLNIEEEPRSGRDLWRILLLMAGLLILADSLLWSRRS